MRDQQHELKQLLNQYVPPNYDSISQHSTKFKTTKRVFMQTSTSFKRTNPRTFANLGGCVSHDYLLYPSLEASQGVLTTNRTTYQKMMRTLRELEREKYKDSYKTVCEQKRKLDYFRVHSKQLSRRNGIHRVIMRSGRKEGRR